MVLGWIVYEAIDIIYFTGKIGYNGVSGIYNWYYQTPKEEENKTEDQCCQREMIEELKKLNAKFELMEKNAKKSGEINNKIE